jgi:hypothetical protein
VRRKHKLVHTTVPSGDSAFHSTLGGPKSPVRMRRNMTDVLSSKNGEKPHSLQGSEEEQTRVEGEERKVQWQAPHRRPGLGRA